MEQTRTNVKYVSARGKEIPDNVLLDSTMDSYGFTAKDLYDLAKLREYETHYRHGGYGLKLGYV